MCVTGQACGGKMEGGEGGERRGGQGRGAMGMRWPSQLKGQGGNCHSCDFIKKGGNQGSY